MSDHGGGVEDLARATVEGGEAQLDQIADFVRNAEREDVLARGPPAYVRVDRPRPDEVSQQVSDE